MKTKVYLLRIKSLSIITSYITLYAIKSSFSQKIALSLLISQYFYRYDCENIRYEKFRLPKKY